MPINQNHLFEDLDGIKCAIVEKNASKERVDFLKRILVYNNYTVVVVVSPPPKPVPVAPAPVAVSGSSADTAMPMPETLPEPIQEPATFTIGVTDVTFNSTNAIFGRSLSLPGGHIVTLAYWQQKDKASMDEVPYFDSTAQ